MSTLSDKDRVRDVLYRHARWALVQKTEPALVYYYSVSPMFVDMTTKDPKPSNITNLYRDGTSLWRPWENKPCPVTIIKP